MAEMAAGAKSDDVGVSRVLMKVRHEAGRHAGRTIDLDAGRYDFGPSTDIASGPVPDTVTFVLDVSTDQAVLSPKTDDLWLDGQRVTRPTAVRSDQAVWVGSDLFVLIDPRISSQESVRVRPPDLQPPSTGRRRRSRRKADEKRRDRQLRRFALDVDQAAKAEHRRRRGGVGLGSDVDRAIQRNRPLELRAPLQVAVALTTQPEGFRPQGLPTTLPSTLETIVSRQAKVIATPATVDLASERLGLAGPPEATLAVCRHLLLAVSASSPEFQVRFDMPVHGTEWGGLVELLDGDQPLFSVGPPGSTASNGIVLSDSPEALTGCDVQMVLDDAGGAVFRRGSQPPLAVLPLSSEVDRTRALADRLATQGRTGTQRRQQPERAANQHTTDQHRTDQRRPTAQEEGGEQEDAQRNFSHGAVMVSGPDQDANNIILASLALDLLSRPNNHELQMFIIDRPDRALIRLNQLPQAKGYATADDPERVVDLLTDLERHTARADENTAILLANELGPLTGFLHRLGRSDLIEHLDRVVGAHDRVELLVAASGPNEDDIDPEMLKRFPSRLRCEDGVAHLSSESAERTLALGGLADRNLTDAVADLKAH